MQSDTQVHILDDHYMRASGYAALLSQKTDENFNGGLKAVISETSTAAIDQISDMTCASIYVVGNRSLSDPNVQHVIEQCLAVLAGRPLILLTDDILEQDILLAISAGISGVVSTETTPEIAVAAIRFILAGGHYFPHSIRPSTNETQWKPHLHPHPGALDAKSAGSGQLTSREVAEPTTSADTTTGTEVNTEGLSLTNRQHEVLMSLQKGLSNKGIGRDLNLSESTVKVHMRHLMRKLGVNNRTQLALSASTEVVADFRTSC